MRRSTKDVYMSKPLWYRHRGPQRAVFARWGGGAPASADLCGPQDGLSSSRHPELRQRTARFLQRASRSEGPCAFLRRAYGICKTALVWCLRKELNNARNLYSGKMLISIILSESEGVCDRGRVEGPRGFFFYHAASGSSHSTSPCS